MLTSPQLRKLHKALLEAFSLDDFESLLQCRIGARLELLATPGSMQSQVSEVLKVAEQAGWTHELIRAAADARPNDPCFAALSEGLGLGAEIRVGGESATPNITECKTGAKLPEGFAAEPWREELPAMEARVCRVEVGGGIVGTGFLVGPDAVLTCYYVVEHVIQQEVSPTAVRCRFDFRQLPDGRTEGLSVRLHSDWLIDREGQEPGELDFALLRLERPLGAEPLNPAAPAEVKRGWVHLPADLPPVPVGAPLMVLSYALGGPLQLALETNGFIGFVENDRLTYRMSTQPGAGGAPCFTSDWKLVALHEKRASADSDNPERFGISAAALRRKIEKDGHSAALGHASSSESDTGSVLATAKPPKPKRVRNVDDPQKDRWGGKSKRSGRALRVEDLLAANSAFTFNAVVASTDGSPLVGPVIFHLHDSYPKSVLRIHKIDEGNRAVLEEVSSYGVYTIGAQVKDAQGKWIGLEYCLSEVPDLPARFMNR
ncbi:MAG TPA: trypsin-like peptidase domain-containing protein [Pirellulaceae bacterium]|nr:trypsin-like peptidase domain-containing protein [Pirellulaceae bacterium]